MKKGKEKKAKIAEKEEKIIKFLKFNKFKKTIFFLIFIIAILFQWWDYNQNCLAIVCSPVIMWIFYYIVWPFDLLKIFILEHVNTSGIFILFAKMIFLFLQIIYWYLATCFLIIPLNTIRGKIGRRINAKREQEHRITKEKIKRDLKKAEEIEKEKKKK